MKLILNFLLIFLFSTVNVAVAEEFNYSIGDLSTCQRRTASIPFKSQYADFRYNDVNKLFTFEAKFSNQNGAPLPDVIHFVVSPGSKQLYYAGHYADIFIDAKNLNDVKVTGYAFNGLNPLPSSGFITNACNGGFEHSFTSRDSDEEPQPGPARLFSTEEPSSAGVVELATVSDEIISGITYRTFELVLDTNQISEPGYTCRNIFHDNAPSCAWSSLATYQGSPTSPDRAGFFLFLSSGGNISYSGDYINSLTWSNCSACFNAAAFTNRSPVCNGISFNNASSAPGKSTIVTAKIFDLDSDSQIINIVNLPSGASASPSSGQTANLTNNNVDVVVNWTPRIGQEGSHPITVLASQNYGGSNASASCNFSIQVDSLGSFADSCLASDLASANTTTRSHVEQMRNLSNKLFKTLNKFKGAQAREKELRKNYTRRAQELLDLSTGFLIDIPNFGYKGTCPEYCPQDTSITLARINAAEAAFKLRSAGQKIGRVTFNHLKSLGRTKEAKISNKQSKELVRLEAEVQNLLTNVVPSELYNCQF